MPKINYVEKRFQEKSMRLIDLSEAIIIDYAQQGYSLTLRQLYYRLVAAAEIENSQRSYKRLGSILNDARLAGLIDWTQIEDRTRSLSGNTHWDNPTQIVRAAHGSFMLDRWKDQENYLEVYVEKDALIGVIGRICRKLDVFFMSCRGYTSQSAMWRSAQRMQHKQDEGKNVTLIHLSDHDPSGVDMTRDLDDRLRVFDVYGVEVIRLALTMGQVNRYGPPPNPTKLTDSRSPDYIRQFGFDSWELDALDPAVISDLIRDEILALRDEPTFDRTIIIEDAMIKTLADTLERYESGGVDKWLKGWDATFKGFDPALEEAGYYDDENILNDDDQGDWKVDHGSNMH